MFEYHTRVSHFLSLHFPQDNMGLSPLHMAAGYCRPSTIKLLVETGADPEIRTQRNERALDLIRNMRNQACVYACTYIYMYI